MSHRTFSFPAAAAALACDASLGQPMRLGSEGAGGVTLKNRVIKAATFESMADMRGIPTQELVNFHARQAKGGVALTLVAYASASCDGRSFPTQISLNSPSPTIHDAIVKMLKRLTAAVHEKGGLAGMQITHAGAFADPSCNAGSPSLGPSRIFNPLTMRWSKMMGAEEMSRIERDFVRAVVVARSCGFDAVELHCGHGYLLSQFLSRATNPAAKEPKDRLEFPLRVVRAVVAAAHNARPYVAVLVKFNCSEKREQDLTFEDVRLYARAFYDAGVDLLVPSGGHVMTNGLHMLRGGRPITAMAAAQKNFVKRTVSRPHSRRNAFLYDYVNSRRRFSRCWAVL